MNEYDSSYSYESDSYGGSPKKSFMQKAKSAASKAAKHAAAATKKARAVGGKAAAAGARRARAAAAAAHSHASKAASSGVAAARRHAGNAHKAMKDAKAHRDHVNALAKARRSIDDAALLEAIAGHSESGRPAHNLQNDENAQRYLELSLKKDVPARGGYYESDTDSSDSYY